MRTPTYDQLTLDLEWRGQPPLVTDAGCAPDHPCGCIESLRRAHLRLWTELVPLFTAGWCLAEPAGDAVHWHGCADGCGRLLRTGCTVQLERRPNERVQAAHAPTTLATGAPGAPTPDGAAAPDRPADPHGLVRAGHAGWTTLDVHAARRR